MSRPLTLQHINLELGSGCNSFGQAYYPTCYVTEFNPDLDCNMSHIDHFCSADNTGLPNKRFKHVIMSNPYGYGFNAEDASRKLMEELLRVLMDQGKIVILSTKSNKFAAPKKVKKSLLALGYADLVENHMEVEEIDHNVDYPAFIFSQTIGISTTPTVRITINVR